MADPWTAFYWRDYIADTGHLSLAQHGAYLLLMAHYYMTGKPIPADQEQIYRIVRCINDADRQATDQVLADFFPRDGEVYRHSRIEKELVRSLDLREKRRELGRKGGLAKARNLLGGLLEQKPKQKPSNHNHSYRIQNQSQKRGGANAPAPAPKKRSSEMPEDFQPNESHNALAAKLGLDIGEVFANFRANRLAKGSNYKDWNRAFENWLRNERKFNAGLGRGSQKSDFTLEDFDEYERKQAELLPWRKAQ